MTYYNTNLAPKILESSPSYSSATESYRDENTISDGSTLAPAAQSQQDSYHKYVVERNILKTSTICSISKLDESEVLRLADLAQSNLSASIIRCTDEVVSKTNISSSEVHGAPPGFSHAKYPIELYAETVLFISI